MSTTPDYRQELLDKIEPFRATNLRYPSEELLAKLEAYKSLSLEERRIARRFRLVEPIVLALEEVMIKKDWFDYKKDEWTEEGDDDFYNNFVYDVR